MTATTMFESQLERLKECLGLREDQEVAKALGMSKAAFSYRKKTNAFPEERLVGLKPTYPDLDIGYVLHGERWTAEDRDDFDLFAATAVALGTTPTDLSKKLSARVNPTARLMYDAMDSARVRSLIEILQWCDDEAIEILARAAAKMRGSQLVPFSQRRTAADDPIGATPNSSRQRHAGISGSAQSGTGKVAAAADLIASLPEGSKVLVVKATEATSPAKPKAGRKLAPKAATK